MAPSPLTKKLRIGPGDRVLLVAPPDGFVTMLGELPEGVQVTEATATPEQGAFDVVRTFVRKKADIDCLAPIAFNAAKPGGIVWFTYPKLASKVKTDINRDAGWDAVSAAGWRGVTQIAVDETWSALRFRPEAEVGTPRR
jgi:hypothetical protein